MWISAVWVTCIVIHTIYKLPLWVCLVYYISYCLLGQAWANPTLIMTMAPMRGIMVCIYLCIIYSAFVAPWFPTLKCFMFSNILACSCLWFASATEQQNDWSYSCLPWRLSTKAGRWMCKHIVKTDSAYCRQWSCSCHATSQCACVNQNDDRWAYCTVVLWHSYQ